MSQWVIVFDGEQEATLCEDRADLDYTLAQLLDSPDEDPENIMVFPVTSYGLNQFASHTGFRWEDAAHRLRKWREDGEAEAA
jgi:hypothetical protein